jgi:FkbM family methyltransferase
LIEPGQIVVDIGMHLGYYTTLFACLVGPTGAVHAFEPTPSTRAIARQNADLFPQVHVHSEAVWSDAKELEFCDYGVRCMSFNSFSEGRLEKNEIAEAKRLIVTTTTLDRFRQELGLPIALAKIDAEGAELEIMRGAEKLLAIDQPILTLEVGDTDGQQSSRRLLEFLAECDYAPWEFSGGQFVRHEPRQSYSYDNLILAPAQQNLASRS